MDIHSTFFVGRDPETMEALDLAVQVAGTDATVLISGESGTGKDLVARLIHRSSLRCRQSYVALNCGAIPETLMESELFGHMKGSFTGATDDRQGKFRIASGGTLFLDEIGEMSKPMQVKLLRILQTGEYTPVGATRVVHCDVRVIAATNQDIDKLVSTGEFRLDLFYRLNVIRIHLPPLRHRHGDVAFLIDHFLQRFGTTYKKSGLTIDETAKKLLLQHSYPGNTRELENVIHRCVILCRQNCIGVEHLPLVMRVERQPDTSDLSDFHNAKARIVEEFERSFLSSRLLACGGIVSRAAARSGLSERVFHQKLRKYGIEGKTFRG